MAAIVAFLAPLFMRRGRRRRGLRWTGGEITRLERLFVTAGDSGLLHHGLVRRKKQQRRRGAAELRSDRVRQEWAAGVEVHRGSGVGGGLGRGVIFSSWMSSIVGGLRSQMCFRGARKGAWNLTVRAAISQSFTRSCGGLTAGYPSHPPDLTTAVCLHFLGLRSPMKCCWVGALTTRTAPGQSVEVRLCLGEKGAGLKNWSAAAQSMHFHVKVTAGSRKYTQTCHNLGVLCLWGPLFRLDY